MDFSFCQMNKGSMDHTYGFRACLHKGGGPQVGEVTCGGLPHLTCKRDQIKMRYYTDRQVTSPTCGLPPPCKLALRDLFSHLAKKLTRFRQKAQENSRQEETYTLTVYIREDIHPFTKLSFYETGRKRQSLSMHFAQI